MAIRSFKDKINELFPWEEEKKARKPERMGSIPPSTSLKAKVHSKPKIAGQEYLELYLMIKEKERLEKYGRTLGNILHQTGEQWRDMKKTVRKSERELPSADEVMGIISEEPLGKHGKGTPEDREPEKKIPRSIKSSKWSY